MTSTARMIAWWDEDGGFLRARHLEPCVHLQPWEQSRVGCASCLHSPSVTVDLIDCKRNPIATREKKKSTTTSTWLVKTQTRTGSPRSWSLSFHSMFYRKNCGQRTIVEFLHLAQIHCHILRVVIVPFIPVITLPPRWRKRWSWPEPPSRRWVNFRALTVCVSKLTPSSLAILILRWNRPLVVFWLSVQEILQWDGSFAIRWVIIPIGKRLPIRMFTSLAWTIKWFWIVF